MQIQAIRYNLDRAGFPIVAPFTAEKFNGNSRRWLIYGRRGKVSATVLSQACNLEFRTRREARQFIADKFK